MTNRAATLVVLATIALTSCQREDKAVAPPEPAAPEAAAPEAAAPAKPTQAPLALEAFNEAALNGETETIRSALTSGTPADRADNDGNTALMLAAFNGHTEIVRLLADAGAKIDALNNLKRSALMFASTGANDETVRLLLDRKAGVNLTDGHENWTPLMFAAAEGHGAIVRMLLDAGADPTAADVDGEDSALFARNRGFRDVAAMIEAAKTK